MANLLAWYGKSNIAISIGAQGNKADADRALRDIETFTSMQARTDPHYAAVEEARRMKMN